MGDHLWTGKPPRRRTRHPGLNSLSPLSVAGWNEYPAKAERVNRHIAWYTSPYPWSRSVCWCLAVGLASGDQRRPTGSGSALKVLHDDALHKSIIFYFTIYLGSCTMVGKQATQRQCSWYVFCVHAILRWSTSSYSPDSTAMNLRRTLMLPFAGTTHRLGSTLHNTSLQHNCLLEPTNSQLIRQFYVYN